MIFGIKVILFFGKRRIKLVKKTINKHIATFLLLCISCCFLVSCLPQKEPISYSYESLCGNLLQIDYVNIYGKREEKIKTLTIEEQEYVVLELSKMYFEQTYFRGMEMPKLNGEAFVFYYPTYKLYFSEHMIKKDCYPEYQVIDGEIFMFAIKSNTHFVQLFSVLK